MTVNQSRPSDKINSNTSNKSLDSSEISSSDLFTSDNTSASDTSTREIDSGSSADSSSESNSSDSEDTTETDESSSQVDSDSSGGTSEVSAVIDTATSAIAPAILTEIVSSEHAPKSDDHTTAIDITSSSKADATSPPVIVKSDATDIEPSTSNESTDKSLSAEHNNWGDDPRPAPWDWQQMPLDYMGILEEQRRTVFYEFRERDGKGEWVLPKYEGIPLKTFLI
jgi:hypothetical protein